MRRNTSARSSSAQVILALITASATLALAGCGSVSAGATASGGTAPGSTQAAPTGIPASSAAIPVCADARKLDRVMLRLTGSQGREILPRAATITDPSRVRALAVAICTLPRLPGGSRHCPAALSGVLLLEFSAQGHAYPPLRIQDSGCANITGAGPARQWAWSSRPGRLLSEAVGGKGRLIPGTYPSSVPTQ